MLFTKDVYENVIEEFSNNRQTVVKALCLHIAHDCIWPAVYCFAEERRISWQKSSYVLMKSAKKAS